MDHFTLTPLETLHLCFDSWAKIAEVCGLARGQVPQRWVTVPSKHIPTLVEASASEGRFRLDANMLTLQTTFRPVVRVRSDVKPNETQAA